MRWPRWALALILAVTLPLVAAPAQAQDTLPTGSSPLVKYGKWLLAAGAIGMNYMAAQSHQQADDNFDELESRCFDDHSLCSLDASGTYVDAESERLYQESLRYDRQARRWLFGGETALLTSAALFVWELTHHTPKPDNIPFEPEVRSLRQATGIGVRIGF
jgi:hypothetical protein